MKCAIQLVFNNENQSIINQLRKTLIANGVHDEAVPINHISLADIEIEDNQWSYAVKLIQKECWYDNHQGCHNEACLSRQR